MLEVRPSPRSRFVILRHETPPGYVRPLHWDLMLEQGPALCTWALEEEPRQDAEIVAWSLSDHRLEYLDFEGELSGNRGRVTRWDEGTYEVLYRTDDELVVRLDGRLLQTEAVITRQDDDETRWSVRFTRRT